MPYKKPERIWLHTYQFWKAGFTQREIEDRLFRLFDEKDIPDQSTISRHIKKFRDLPPEPLREDVPFVWSSMTEVPWDASRAILDAVQFHREARYEEELGRPFTRRLAKWVWRVLYAFGPHDAINEASQGVSGLSRSVHPWLSLEFPRGSRRTPDGGDIMSIAQEYAWREVAHIVLGESFDTRVLDLKLACRSWQSLEHLLSYQNERNRQGLLHSGSSPPDDLEWLTNVAPGAAKATSQIELAYREAGYNPDLKVDPSLAAMKDGLLPSQLREARESFEDLTWLSDKDKSEETIITRVKEHAESGNYFDIAKPWYVNYFFKITMIYLYRVIKDTQ